eukprot:TRINITY_DN20482_c0_g1_i1.p1 TRINITY_DN20482_c0_g1~~TRINITY_DN20482_c0_g1_i1.p1  ORF type:complete len:318 (+),score=96.80 TRINITY_DN20482_c0_g1_i1:46-954(+)
MPHPEPDEVALEVRCAGVSPEEWLWAVPGGTVVGRVVKAGENVKDRSVGDWLVGLRGPDQPCGGLGATSLLETHNCVPCSEMSKEQYLLLPFLGLVVSAHLLLSQELRAVPGETLLIPACAEQAIYVQVAAALGLVVFTPKSSALPSPAPANVRLLGADPSDSASLAREVLLETSGLGVDTVLLSPNGEGNDMLELAKVVTVRGSAVVPCYAKHGMPSSLALSLDKLLSAKSCALRYHSLESWLAAPTKEGRFTHVMLEAVRLITTGCIEPPSVTQMSLKHAVEVMNGQAPRHLSVAIGERA